VHIYLALENAIAWVFRLVA